MDYGKSAGLLFLLRRTAFKDPRIQELHAGRLALLQATIRSTGMPISILGVYQHVWRTHLTSAQNREYRSTIWQALEQAVQRVPARHSLVVCGDFNATLGPEHPIVGPSATRCTDHHDAELQALMRRQSLTAANTWHCKPSHTYYAPDQRSQIDFVLIRQQAAKHRATYAHPLHSFPVGATRLNGHYPIQIHLPVFSYHGHQPSSTITAHNSSALQQAVRDNTPAAQELQLHVAARLPEVDTSNLLSAHHHINRILLEETSRLFPAVQATDSRVSAQPGYRTLARSVWGIYHRLKHPGVCTFRNILAKWRLATAFARASRQLTQQSRIFKRAFYESQVDIAEAAAAKGDQRSLHLIVRRLSPKPRHLASRLRGPDGTLLSREGELQAIVQHSNDTFAVHPDDTPLVPLEADFTISAAELSAELSKLGLAKAVPKHVAPSATWRLCAMTVGTTLSDALQGHFRKGKAAKLDEDWKDSYVVWIPKPNKPPDTVTSLRPIGLTSPASKALAGSLRPHLLAHLQPALKDLPQFAYAKQRGTADAIAKAHSHFHQVDRLLQLTKANRFQQQAGRKSRQCAGGLCISLDLSRAFDGVTRSHIYQAMKAQQVPQDVITIVQQLHQDARYMFQVGDVKGSTLSTNGIKQGCVIAPYLWNYFTLAFFTLLQQHRSAEWIQNVLSLFADDVWGAWLITSGSDLQAAIADVALILSTLEQLCMTINYSKTAILLKLTGKEACRLKREHTFMKAGQLHLKLRVGDRECSIPIKDQHEYLGTIVTYHSRLERNMTHRIKACQQRYQGLRKLLNGSHHLSAEHRIRLWRACVCTSVFYSQHIVGVTTHTLQRLTTLLTRHLRAILRVPSHLTHVTNHAVWSQARLPLPGWQLQQALLTHQQRLITRQTTDPDITTTPQALDFLDQQATRLEAILLKAATTIVVETPDLPLVNCPRCDKAFPTENAMRIHCSLQHKHLPQIQTKTPTIFDPAVHSQAGMPACRLCNRQFFRWTHLKQHIESSACQALGGASFERSPVPDSLPAPILQPPTAQLSIFADDENNSNMPLVRRPAFQQQCMNIEHWLSMPAVRLELKSHCAICHMWIASFRHVKQHYNRIHAAEHPDLLPKALKLCSTFKSHLRRDSDCIWCGHKVGAPHRHTQQCTPLIQLTLAQLYCQDVLGQGRPDHQRGGRDIRRLLGLPAGRVLPVRDSPPIAEEASTRATAEMEHATQTPARPSRLLNTGPLSRPPTTSTSRATGGPPQSLEQGCAEAGGDHKQAAPRENLRPLHEERDQRHPGHPDEDCQGLAHQEGSGHGGTAVSPPHGPASQHAARGDELSSASSCHGGGQGQIRSHRMAHERRGLELSCLEPHRAQASGRPQPNTPAARRGHPAVKLPAPELKGRGHPKVRSDATDEHSGKARVPVRHLSFGGVPEGMNCKRNLRDHGEADRMHIAEPHRRLNEEGFPPPHDYGQEAGRLGVSKAGPLHDEAVPHPHPKPCTFTDPNIPSTPVPAAYAANPHRPGLNGMDSTGDEGILPSSLPRIRLQGGNNSCYLIMPSYTDCAQLCNLASCLPSHVRFLGKHQRPPSGPVV